MSDLYSGLFLMAMGMGTVFLFLGLLILVTEGIRRIWGEPEAPARPVSSIPLPPSTGRDEALRAAVVAATLIHHRGRRS